MASELDATSALNPPTPPPTLAPLPTPFVFSLGTGSHAFRPLLFTPPQWALQMPTLEGRDGMHCPFDILNMVEELKCTNTDYDLDIKLKRLSEELREGIREIWELLESIDLIQKQEQDAKLSLYLRLCEVSSHGNRMVALSWHCNGGYDESWLCRGRLRTVRYDERKNQVLLSITCDKDGDRVLQMSEALFTDHLLVELPIGKPFTPRITIRDGVIVDFQHGVCEIGDKIILSIDLQHPLPVQTIAKLEPQTADAKPCQIFTENKLFMAAPTANQSGNPGTNMLWDPIIIKKGVNDGHYRILATFYENTGGCRERWVPMSLRVCWWICVQDREVSFIPAGYGLPDGILYA